MNVTCEVSLLNVAPCTKYRQEYNACVFRVLKVMAKAWFYATPGVRAKSADVQVKEGQNFRAVISVQCCRQNDGIVDEPVVFTGKTADEVHRQMDLLTEVEGTPVEHGLKIDPFELHREARSRVYSTWIGVVFVHAI